MNDLFEDHPKTHVVLDQRDKNDFIIERDDFFGHWRIRREKGLVPEQLRGAYTRKEVALSEITNYLNTFALPKKIKEIKVKN